MATMHHLGLRRQLRQVASVLGIVALSVLTTLLVQRVLTPPRAAAQADQGQVIRASGFEVVGPDGIVVARLAPGRVGGGRLTVFDSAGNQRAAVAGAGVFAAFDPDGKTLRFLSGYTPAPGAPAAPAINGVQLDPNGTIGPVLSQPYLTQP